MAKRKKVTPFWLSLIRKIMIYLGGTTFLTMFIGKLWADPETQIFALEAWMVALGIIQIICDFSYQKDPLADMPADPVKPKIKP